jgi:DNA-directed RNA polymerase subunit omega
MARVTVEDCVQRIPNRFDLVMLAAQRSRELNAGATLTLDRDNDKNPVVSLREIADETISLEELRNSLVRGHQRVTESEEPEPEISDLIVGEQVWAGGADQRSGAIGADDLDMNADDDEGDEEEQDFDPDVAALDIDGFDPGAGDGGD